MDSKMLIAIPTYNERENLEPLYRRIRELSVQAELLIVDDNSPDGTGKFADQLAAQDRSLRVIHRTGKLGIGSAHRDIIRWAYSHGYQRLLTMDSDFTHQPEDIPSFLIASGECDVIIGTRFIDPESLKDWEPFRKRVTYFGCKFPELRRAGPLQNSLME